MSNNFSAKVKNDKEKTTIHCDGEIDINTISNLQGILEKINNEEKVILNLSDVTFIDSAGLGIIAKHAKMYSNNNIPLQIDCIDNFIYKLFKLSNLDQSIISLNLIKEEK